MFAEVKAMLPISGDAYDQEIILQIKAAVLDLTRTAEIVLPGSVDISVDDVTGAVVDESDQRACGHHPHELTASLLV